MPKDKQKCMEIINKDGFQNISRFLKYLELSIFTVYLNYWCTLNILNEK